MQAFFLGLMAAQAAVIAIYIATRVALQQIAAARYSPVAAAEVVRGWVQWTAIGFMAATMVLLGLVAGFLSLPPPRVVPDFGTPTVAMRIVVGLVGFIAVILSALLLWVSAHDIGRRTRPSRLIEALLTRFSERSYRDEKLVYEDLLLPLFDVAQQCLQAGDIRTFKTAVEGLLGVITTSSSPSVPLGTVLTFVEDLDGLAIERNATRFRSALIRCLTSPLSQTDLDRNASVALLQAVEHMAVDMALSDLDTLAPVVNKLFEVAGSTPAFERSGDAMRVIGTISVASARFVPNPRGFEVSGGIGYPESISSPTLEAVLEGIYAYADEIEAGNADEDVRFMWYDVVLVTMLALVRRVSDVMHDDQLDSTIAILAGQYSKVALAEGKRGEADGPWRAALMLRQINRELNDRQLDYLDGTKNAIAEAAFRLCAVGKAYDLKADFGRVDEEAVDLAKGITGDLSAPAMEALIHPFEHGQHEAVWGAIKEIGVQRGDNFGLMFDASTGEDYPENDPRRK